MWISDTFFHDENNNQPYKYLEVLYLLLFFGKMEVCYILIFYFLVSWSWNILQTGIALIIYARIINEWLK